MTFQHDPMLLESKSLNIYVPIRVIKVKIAMLDIIVIPHNKLFIIIQFLQQNTCLRREITSKYAKN